MRRTAAAGEPEGMTEYFHGRPVRPVRPARRRRRSGLVLAAAAVVAALVWFLLGDTSGAAESATPTPAGPPARTADQPERSTAKDLARSGLDRELAARFVRAQRAAADDGVELTLTSGKRSAAEQQALVDDAVKRYGSVTEAHRWVLPPDASSHVKGLAVDVGPTSGARWLGEHGLDFGLCRVYANEVWHFEKLLRGRETCPAMHPDSSSGW